MSLTRGSPSCESRRRDTASYSYSPCWALVVDLMCHSKNGLFRERAISLARSVLPVPGSPLMSSGRDRTTAAFTAAINSSVAIYRSVPRNSLSIVRLLSCDAQDLHGISAARDAAQLTLGEDDVIAFRNQFLAKQQAEDGKVNGLAPVLDIVGDRIDAAVQCDTAAGTFVPGKGINRDIRTDPRHPQCRRAGFGQGDNGLDVQVVRRIHHRGGDGLVGVREEPAVALPGADMFDLVLLRADHDLRHGLHHLRGMLAGSGLRRQHHRVGAVHD